MSPGATVGGTASAALSPEDVIRLGTEIQRRIGVKTSRNEPLARFLSTDETVLAVMAAAVDVVEAAGVRVDRGEGAAAHLRRAVHWRRYSRGPAGALHRSCGADIARGSLRLLGRVR